MLARARYNCARFYPKAFVPFGFPSTEHSSTKETCKDICSKESRAIDNDPLLSIRILNIYIHMMLYILFSARISFHFLTIMFTIKHSFTFKRYDVMF